VKLTATFENVTNGIFDIIYKGHATEVIRLTNAIYVAFYMQVKWGVFNPFARILPPPWNL